MATADDRTAEGQRAMEALHELTQALLDKGVSAVWIRERSHRIAELVGYYEAKAFTLALYSARRS